MQQVLQQLLVPDAMLSARDPMRSSARWLSGGGACFDMERGARSLLAHQG
jgi:hypothetical protein